MTGLQIRLQFLLCINHKICFYWTHQTVKVCLKTIVRCSYGHWNRFCFLYLFLPLMLVTKRSLLNVIPQSTKKTRFKVQLSYDEARAVWMRQSGRLPSFLARHFLCVLLSLCKNSGRQTGTCVQGSQKKEFDTKNTVTLEDIHWIWPTLE